MIPRLKIMMICPAPRWSRKGNRVTADRWARFLRELGHQIEIREEFDGSACDMLIALHARRSAQSIRGFAREYPSRPLLVALTGTDLYRDIRTSRPAQRSLDLATRLVVLQPKGVDELSPGFRAKARVILQSARPTATRSRNRHGVLRGTFRVCVLGHLRHEKDPLRTALATRLMPGKSRVHVTHLGAALDPAMGRWARAESARNPRYTWLGEVAHGRARRILARSDLMVLTSRMEGGANVLSEAVVDEVPIVASRIPSTVGILGAEYPGLYPVGDTEKLAALLSRAETDSEFYARLTKWCARLAPRLAPEAERDAWRRLVQELFKTRMPSHRRARTAS
jgi:putative glycosyltransferase (TIGR04348 family)